MSEALTYIPLDGYNGDSYNIYPSEPHPKCYIIDFYEQQNKQMESWVAGELMKVGRQKTSHMVEFCKKYLDVYPDHNSWDAINASLIGSGYKLCYSHKVSVKDSSHTFYVVCPTDTPPR